MIDLPEIKITIVDETFSCKKINVNDLWHRRATKTLGKTTCDAPNPGGPLTTRQPAEIYESHVMRPIHVQKWLLEPTHHTHKMYIFIQK